MSTDTHFKTMTENGAYSTHN